MIEALGKNSLKKIKLLLEPRDASRSKTGWTDRVKLE